MSARVSRWRMRLAAVATVLSITSCTDAAERAEEPPRSDPATTVDASPSTTAPSTTAQSPTTTRDTSVFASEILKLTIFPHIGSDMRAIISITPYFVVAKLKSIAPSEVYKSGIPFELWSRGVSLTFEVSELRPLAASKFYPGPIEPGREIIVDFANGAYTTDDNRAQVDAITRSVIDVAPLGASFALFVGPMNTPDRWVTNGPQGWAYLHDDGRLSPMQAIDPDGNPSWWPTVDLPRLRALIDEMAPR